MKTTTVIAGYEIIEELGDSPQATVYKAYPEKGTTRLLTVKVLKTAFLSDNKKAQFRQKIEQLKVLNDPMVITPKSFDE
ncbi:MAG: hypothetical protein HYX80_07130, partial [Chloroflexi bacterium]|nr:hypothetical protein [Chloroflexota bacterium]